MKAVILAAGMGSRLGPIGSLVSKPALPLLGVPMITRVLRSIVDFVEEIIVVVNPDDSYLIEVLHAPEWKKHRVQIVVQNEPLGSGDALRTAWPLIEDDCLVTACDSIMENSFIEDFVGRFRSDRLDALVGVMQFEQDSGLPGSVVAISRTGRIREIIEKPTTEQLITDKMALPIYAVGQSFGVYLDELELSERSEYEIPQAFQNLIDQGGAVGSVLAEKRVTINSPGEYLQAVISMLSDQADVQTEPGAEIDKNAMIHAPVHVERGVRVHAGATVGPGAYLMAGSVIHADAIVEDSIVFKQAHVDEHVVVRGKIVLPTSIIDPQISRDSRDQARHQ